MTFIKAENQPCLAVMRFITLKKNKKYRQFKINIVAVPMHCIMNKLLCSVTISVRFLKNRIPTFKIPDPDLCYFVFLRIHNPNPKRKKTSGKKIFNSTRSGSATLDIRNEIKNNPYNQFCLCNQ